MEHWTGHLTLIPTQAGEPIVIPADRPAWGFHWFGDGQRLLVTGNEEGRPIRAWVVDTRDGSRHAVTPGASAAGWCRPTDGRRPAHAPVAITCTPVDGEGDPRPTPGFVPGDHMRQWSADGRFLYVSEAYARPARLFRLDLQTGERRLWREFATNPAGIVGTVDPAITPDGSAWAYAVLRHINDLILVEGIQ